MSSLWVRWGVPRYRQILDSRVKDSARCKMLGLIDILEEQGLPPDEIEHRVLVYREESLSGLNLQLTLVEQEFGIKKEEESKPRVKRVKRTKRVKKEKRPSRGGFFS